LLKKLLTHRDNHPHDSSRHFPYRHEFERSSIILLAILT
jgi:hypothetical protein